MTDEDSVALSPIAWEVLNWCADDFTEVFGIHSVVRRMLDASDAEQEKLVTLSTVEVLVALDLIAVGDMRSEVRGLAVCDAPRADIIARVRTSWEASPPSMGWARGRLRRAWESITSSLIAEARRLNDLNRRSARILCARPGRRWERGLRRFSDVLDPSIAKRLHLVGQLVCGIRLGLAREVVPHDLCRLLEGLGHPVGVCGSIWQ